MKVLVVDDSLATREIIKRTLQQFEYRKLFVRCAQSVSEALQLLDSWHPDIVLTDWYMPEQTGLELLEGIRRNDSQLPVGVVSTIDEKEKILEAQSAGCSFFLSKPFTDAQLHSQLQPIVEALEQQEFLTEQAVPLKEGLPLPKTEQLERLMKKNISEDLILKAIRAQQFDESKLPSVMAVYAERGTQKIRVIMVLDIYAVCVLASSCKIIDKAEALKAIHHNEVHPDIMQACKEALDKTAYAFLDNQSRMSLFVRSCKFVSKAHPKIEQIYNYPLDSRMDLSCEREGMAQGKMLIVGV
ncbi:response regulator [Pseudoalteromonas sp. SS15]|uniref:response regulator n=1 Tax=Pseudoalteromonas sp. SS15 TaxID=3139393 RepID=UPI003BA8BD92